ncbi:hypothetical protein WKI27_00755 [Brevundimonas vesicularis]|uniref:hypothetical protein n=1 Tax=Brevundimonas vesicularis TaxID=41276 RepID=UPI0030BD7B8C
MTDSIRNRETIKVAALDDQDAIRLGELYFESDQSLRLLEVVGSSTLPLTAFMRAAID